jgi:hypothetical protein
MTAAQGRFEAIWPTLHLGEAIYCEWPQILHVRVMFGEWDDRFLMLEMKALDTYGFAQRQRPSPRCGASWDQLRCSEVELASPCWSLLLSRELIRAVVLRAAESATPRWSRAQYQALSEFIADWELDRIERSPADGMAKASIRAREGPERRCPA